MNIFIATINHTTGILNQEESWHCAKVLRKKPGDAIGLIDGKGHFYEGQLSSVSEKQCTATITSGPRAQAQRPYSLHLAIAPTKQIDRVEWMVEKAVEIGIDEISFMQCKNSERTAMKPERMIKIVESAVKQSLQSYIPKVNGLLPFKEVIAKAADQKLIAHCFEAEKTAIKAIDFRNKSSLILIGPEGDFTREEADLALAGGFTAITLGHNRLRSETAGLYVCQAAALLS